MKKDENMALVKQEIIQAITYFIDRQDLVAQAMGEMGLDLQLVGQVGPGAWISTNPNSLKYGKRLLDLIGENIPDAERQKLSDIMGNAETFHRIPQLGVWIDSTGADWTCFLHGFGCLLQNVQTKEPIDWDCPDVFAFDQYFFQRHLEWQLQSVDRKGKLKHTQAWVMKNGKESIGAIVKELIDDDLIRKHKTPFATKLTLVDSQENPHQG